MRRVVIIGGGAIGSAIAYFLNQDPSQEPFDVTVVERDFSYTQASSALSASSIRQQFSTAINIEMSLYGIEFFRRLGETLRVGDNVFIGPNATFTVYDNHNFRDRTATFAAGEFAVA